MGVGPRPAEEFIHLLKMNYLFSVDNSVDKCVNSMLFAFLSTFQVDLRRVYVGPGKESGPKRSPDLIR